MFNGCMSTHVVYQDVDEEYERWGEGGDEAIDTKVLPGGGPGVMEGTAPRTV